MASDDTQDIPLLVGHPFTEHPHVIITSAAGELTVEQVMPNMTMSAKNKVPLWVNATAVIPKNHNGHISVCTEISDTTLCFEGGLSTSNKLIPRCVVFTDNMSNTVVPVMNLADKYFTVKKGNTVTKGITFTEVCTESDIHTTT